VDDTIEQGTTSAQIATQPTIKALGGAKVDEADDVAITGPKVCSGWGDSAQRRKPDRGIFEPE
jgi:hypothetical protein